MHTLGLTLEDLNYFLPFQIYVFTPKKIPGTMFQGSFPQEASYQEGI